jgi:glyoxylase-like metal-dependent hydrolase (beta-lactamase superfamily II)
MVAHHIKHWKIGDVEIARIVEVNAFPDDLSMLFKDGTPEMLLGHEWLKPHFVTPEGKMIISFQAFAVKSQGKSMMIDTCIGADRKRPYDVFCNMQTSFLDDLRIAGFPVAGIDTVLCTHLHFDHVGWNTQLVDGKWVPTFPNARYLFSAREWEHWSKADRSDIHAAHLDDAVQPIIDANLADFVSTDHRITDEVWLEPTHGHTPGHCSVHISSRGQQAVITGDLMHHAIQMALPDKPGNFDMDPPTAAATRRAFLERYEDRKALVIGSHFPDPTSGWILRDGPAWRFEVE